jgi:NAD(P)-dependent dehydrogenase (short-subunit alcohol dehydrogenase family)
LPLRTVDDTLRAMTRDRRQEDRHFVVTGAGTGIGRAIATRLASEGARLTLLARRTERLEAAAAELRAQYDARVHVGACDIRDSAAVDAAFARAFETLGPLHGVVANAGIGGENRPGPDDRFLDLVATNLSGTYFTLRAAQRHLAPGPDPRHLVVIASILARFGVPGYTGYCASKAGLLGLVRALALELAPGQVQVNAIVPGWVATEMAWQGIDGFAAATGQTREQALAEAMKPVPLGRMSEPADIAGVCAWLVSSDARGVTGQGIDVNNGAWMG